MNYLSHLHDELVEAYITDDYGLHKVYMYVLLLYFYFFREHSNATYKDVYNRSIQNPQEFWGEAASDIVWFKKYDKVMHSPKYPWTKW